MLRFVRIATPISGLNRCAIRGVATSEVPKQNRVRIGNCNINNLKVGNDAHTVLIMPGMLGVILHFKPQVECFDREKITLVVWEPHGYGKSRPPEKKFDSYFFERDADTAYEFMQALIIPEYSVFGWSGGGLYALIHAAKYPSAVKKFVVPGGFAFFKPHEIDNYKRKLKIKIEPSDGYRVVNIRDELFEASIAPHID